MSSLLPPHLEDDFIARRFCPRISFFTVYFTCVIFNMFYVVDDESSIAI